MAAEALRGIGRRLEAIDRQIVVAGREDATYRHLITAPCHRGIATPTQ